MESKRKQKKIKPIQKREIGHLIKAMHRDMVASAVAKKMKEKYGDNYDRPTN